MIFSKYSVARALKQAATKRPNYPQNPYTRLGAVQSYDSQGYAYGTVPVILDGEDTAIQAQLGVAAFTADRVALTKIGNAWTITSNFSTPKPTFGKAKANPTTRTANATPTNDPELTTYLPRGTWFVQFEIIYAASTVGKLYTAWTTPADTLINLRQCQGPGNAATTIRSSGGGSRWSSHNLPTMVDYNGDNGGGYLTCREWSTITTTTGGTLAFSWSRGLNDTVATTVHASSTMLCTRIN